MLRIDLYKYSNQTAYAEYSEFWIGPESDNYRLHVSGYSGTAGMHINKLYLFLTTLDQCKCSTIYIIIYIFYHCVDGRSKNGHEYTIAVFFLSVQGF
jgi:hypothetical protein